MLREQIHCPQTEIKVLREQIHCPQTEIQMLREHLKVLAEHFQRTVRERFVAFELVEKVVRLDASARGFQHLADQLPVTAGTG